MGCCNLIRYFFLFKVCKSVHQRTIQINHQPDATIFQFIILTFIYSSTCFGRFPAHHQELNDCSSNLWFYLRIVVTVVRPAGPTTNTARLSPRYEGKTRGCHCSHWAPDDGRENTRTCWAVNKCQENKLENCCIWLVIYLHWWGHYRFLPNPFQFIIQQSLNYWQYKIWNGQNIFKCTNVLG